MALSMSVEHPAVDNSTRTLELSLALLESVINRGRGDAILAPPRRTRKVLLKMVARKAGCKRKGALSQGTVRSAS